MTMKIPDSHQNRRVLVIDDGHDDRLLILQKPFSSVEVSQLATSLTRKWDLARQARERLEAAESANVAKSQFLANTPRKWGAQLCHGDGSVGARIESC
jgi:hypothetical protein